jgi:hypothetical protein
MIRSGDTENHITRARVTRSPHGEKRSPRTAKFSLAVLVVAVAAVLAVPAASSAGAGAVSSTQKWHNVTETSTDVNPCSGATGTLTLTYNGVFHVTTLANGTYWATLTQTGAFSFVPFDLSQPSYTGHFTVWDGDNWNNRNTTETATFSIHGTGSDGSTLTLHEVEHISSSASGATLSFDKLRCG